MYAFGYTCTHLHTLANVPGKTKIGTRGVGTGRRAADDMVGGPDASPAPAVTVGGSVGGTIKGTSTLPCIGGTIEGTSPLPRSRGYAPGSTLLRGGTGGLQLGSKLGLN